MRFIRSTTTASALALAAALGSGTAMAQQNQAAGQQTQAQQGQGDIKVLSAWNYDELYATGITAEEMLDADVYGPTGDEIGSVENVIVGDNDKIVAIIAQVGGFWDIGDTHVAVPWDKVSMMDDGFQIPVTEETVDDYGLYADETIVNKQALQQTRVVDDDLVAGQRTWKLTNLIDDYATLRGGVGYGYVTDAVFDRDGTLKAVVVERDRAGYGVGGPIATPFYGYGYGWNPNMDAYEMPYSQEELAGLEPFEDDRMEGDMD